MARSKGTKNSDYRQTRSAILRSVRACLLHTGSERISFRQMAEEAGVSVPTLRHYFSTRTALVNEVFADLHHEGLRYLAEAGTSDLPLEDSMQQAADLILAGMRFGRMDKVHTLGLTEGLGDPELGPGYLNSILEPSLQALERRLDLHASRGELRDISTRYAAIAFAAPLILASLHQSGLGGNCLRPLDLTGFAKSHAHAFALAYRNPTVGRNEEGERNESSSSPI